MQPSFKLDFKAKLSRLATMQTLKTSTNPGNVSSVRDGLYTQRPCRFHTGTNLPHENKQSCSFDRQPLFLHLAPSLCCPTVNRHVESRHKHNGPDLDNSARLKIKKIKLKAELTAAI